VTTRGVQVAAQAKINLRLKILAREASGFHQIETLFLRLTLADTVRVRRTNGPRSLDVRGEVDLSLIGPVEKNLAWRAAEAYLDAVGDSSGFAIEIEKRIPIGGGLGGGSADAGAVLRAIDATSAAPMGEIGLMAIAARLGSDIPFLTSTHVYALAWGRGERLLALEPPEQRGVMLLIPPVAVNTAEAYGWLSAARDAAGVRPGSDPLALDVKSLSDWTRIAELAENDFEAPVSARHVEIAESLRGVREGSMFEVVMMSGSGSTVFAVASRNLAAFGGDALTRLERPFRLMDTSTALRVEPVTPID
jgi:4-diphosphocytidyl-2-C-methyl-D-erythritol kinase